MAPANIDRELDAPLPPCCPHCGGDVVHERDAEQFQTDLPALPSPVVTRFTVGVGRCRSCGKRVQGRHREQTSDALGAAGSQIGPVAKGWVAWLHYGLGLSFGKCAVLLGRLGIDVTAGAICQSSQTMGTALVPVKNSIIERVNASPTVTMDETGWRVEGFSSWLWVAATEDATAYNVAAGRGFDQACDALDARDADPAERAAVADHVVEMIELLHEQAHPHDENRKLIKHLYGERQAIVTFLTHPGVEATNWRGEQAIRPAVVNRKVWGGNRTWRGASTQGTITSVLRTATQQGIDAIDYLARHARAPDPAGVPLFS